MKNIINSAYYSKEIKKKSGHHHDCHQLILVVSGSMKIDVGGKSCVVNEGELVIVSRYESHSVTVLSDVYERYVVRINPYFESDNMAYSLFINRPVGFSNVINVRDRFEEIASIFSSIVREKASGEAMSEDMNQLLLNLPIRLPTSVRRDLTSFIAYSVCLRMIASNNILFPLLQRNII